MGDAENEQRRGVRKDEEEGEGAENRREELLKVQHIGHSR